MPQSIFSRSRRKTPSACPQEDQEGTEAGRDRMVRPAASAPTNQGSIMAALYDSETRDWLHAGQHPQAHHRERGGPREVRGQQRHPAEPSRDPGRLRGADRRSPRRSTWPRRPTRRPSPRARRRPTSSGRRARASARSRSSSATPTPSRPPRIIAASGFKESGVPRRQKGILGLFLTTNAGEIRCEANASKLAAPGNRKTGNRDYHWRHGIVSTPTPGAAAPVPAAWINDESTPVARTLITGIPPLTYVAVQVAVKDSVGLGDWSQSVIHPGDEVADRTPGAR